jgi:PHD/YefM family antitoxin component YafN of YafNO toxin-antitoxin module
MSTVSAAEIKKHGVSILSPVLIREGEALITVRGKATYVVMTMEKYNELRESELAQAVRETRADYEAGRVDDRTVGGHMRRLEDEV